MNKPLLSRQAGRVTAYIFKKKPSTLIPFKGDFPVVPEWRMTEFYESVNSHQYLEDCPDWVQTAVLRGEKLYNIDRGFTQYLKDKGILGDFNKMSAADKSTHLVAFLDDNCLGLDRLKI